MGLPEAIGRIPVVLPVGLVRDGQPPLKLLWITPLRGQEHLYAGLAPFLLETPKSDAKAALVRKKWLEQAKAVVVAVVRAPVTFWFTPKKGAVCVDDLDEQDIEAIFVKAVTLADTIYFGVDRTVDLPLAVAKGQNEVAVLYDRILSRYGGYKLIDLKVMDDRDLSELYSILEAGVEEDVKQAKRNAPPKTPRTRRRK